MSVGWSRISYSIRACFPFVIILVALASLLWSTVAGVVNRWFKYDEAYSHGFLLLGVSILLVARSARRHSVTLGFYPIWLVPFAFALAAYSLGEIMRVQALSELTIVPLILGAAAILLGWNQVKQFIIPVGILFLAVPFWDYLSWTLQIMTVEVNRLLLGLFDINFRVEGIFVHLIDIGIFEVANGCSGLRYLLVGQLLALIYGELNLKRVTSRLWLYLVAVGLGLVANWIRVFVIIYVGHESNMQSNLINEHDDFGWMVFAVTLIPLFIVGRLLEKKESNGEIEANNKSLTPSPVLASSSSGNPSIAVAAIGALLFLTWIALPAAPESREVGAFKHDAVLVSEELWLPLFSRSLAGWTPIVERPDRLLERSYVSREGLSPAGDPNETLLVGLYSYDAQWAGHELVHYNNRLYSSSGFVVQDVFDITSIEGVPMSGMTIKRLGSEDFIHLAFAYYVEGSWENNELEAKLAQLPGILNRRTDASLLVVALQCVDCNAQERLATLSPKIHLRAEEYLDQLYLQKD
ncbi:exosortase [Marinobacter halotolerans]|uniref:exosortase n=1 Tax=Marinobacter halotolerans TaxID=1569211 RepID=UPI00124819A7|nr:exosortase [Marinobacter halotolerans]